MSYTGLDRVKEILKDIVEDYETEAQTWIGDRQRGWDACCERHAKMAGEALAVLTSPGFVLVPGELLERAVSELTADIGSANWGVIGDLNKILTDATPPAKQEGE